MPKFTLVNEDTRLKVEAEVDTLEELLEIYKKAEKLKKYDITGNGKIDQKDFAKASKVLNKAKKLNNNNK